VSSELPALCEYFGSDLPGVRFPFGLKITLRSSAHRAFYLIVDQGIKPMLDVGVTPVMEQPRIAR
jgi:hypothetical protein